MLHLQALTRGSYIRVRGIHRDCIAILRVSSTAKPKSRRAVMSWASQADSNEGLINNLKRFQVVQSPEVVSALKATDRRHYVLHKHAAYIDAPTPIGYGQTISAPHMHGTALELLKDQLKPGCKALDVGSGSGYLAAVMARMVTRGEGHGHVVGIEVVPELVEWANKNVENDPGAKRRMEDGSLKLIYGDGWKGLPEEGPYDAIHVGAAAASVPKALVDQLSPGGRMVIPVGPEGEPQVLAVVDKRPDGHVSRHDLMDVQYVPLIQRQRER